MTAGARLPVVSTVVDHVVTDIPTRNAATNEESSQWSTNMKTQRALLPGEANGSGRECDVGYASHPTQAVQARSERQSEGPPKGSKNESTILHGSSIGKSRSRMEDVRQVTILEAMLTRFAQDSLKGNVKSAAFLLNRYGTLVSGEIQHAELNGDDEVSWKPLSQG